MMSVADVMMSMNDNVMAVNNCAEMMTMTDVHADVDERLFVAAEEMSDVNDGDDVVIVADDKMMTGADVAVVVAAVID